MLANPIAIALESSAPSVSLGTVSHGSLRHGKRLPARGANFRACSTLALLLGRNTVNDRVRGAVTTLPTWPRRGFGYGREFDSTGRAGSLQVDFDAAARHLAALDRAARRHGLAIQLVIIAPEYRRVLAQSPCGRDVLARLPFMQGKPWIRHDEHYHVDFAER